MSRLHIQHVKSAQPGKAPSADTINFGEIAINYYTSSPTIYIKDSASNIVAFTPTNITGATITGTGSIITGASFANKVLTLSKGNFDTELDTGSTNAVQNKAVASVIIENERVVSNALNVLNDNKLDITAQTVTAVTINGSGNVVANAAFGNKALTLTKGTAVTTVTTAGTGNAITGYTLSNGTLTLDRGEVSPTIDTELSTSSTNCVQNKVITQTILDNEYVISAAINELNDRKLDIDDFHDTATTKDGHYNPGSTATAMGDSNGVIKTIALDGKGHITGVTTGSTPEEIWRRGEGEGSAVLINSDDTNEAYGNNAVAEGDNTVAYGEDSHAEGYNTIAQQLGYKYTNTGAVSNTLTTQDTPTGLAVGDVVSIVNSSKYYNCATITAINGKTITFDSLPFNTITESSGIDAKTLFVVAKPNVGTVDISHYAHAEGWNSKAQGLAAHAEGRDAKAYGQYSHAEGRDTTALYAAHAEGQGTQANGERSHAEGHNSVSNGSNSHAEGNGTTAHAANSHTEGSGTSTYGDESHAEGNGTVASGSSAHAEGIGTTAVEIASHAEGRSTVSSGGFSHSEGENTESRGLRSHAEGDATIAKGGNSHAEGSNTTADGANSHAEGGSSWAFGDNSHAEGTEGRANGFSSHVEGKNTLANGDNSHAEGWGAHAEAPNSHAEGEYSIASGNSSHAEGGYTQTSNDFEHASGYGNISHGGGGSFASPSGFNTLYSVGIGLKNTTSSWPVYRRNAFEIMQNGNMYVYGVGSYSGDSITNKKTLQQAVNAALTGATTAGTGDAITGITVSDGMITLQKGSVSITVDDTLSTSSTNAVENRVITQTILDNEEITAAALNDLNTNKLDASAQTISTVVIDGVGNALTGATFTGKTLTLSKGNMIVADSATTQEGHYDPYNATGNTTTAGMSGSQTLSWGGSVSVPYVVFDNKGHEKNVGLSTLIMPANPNTDVSTTEGGHYAPSSTSTTIGDASGFIKTIALDSKKHVVGVTTGSTGVSDVIINGNGNVLSNASFSNGNLTITKGSAVTNVSSNGATNGVVTGYTYNDGSLVLNKGVYGITGITTSGSGNVVTNAEVTNNTLSITKGNAVVGTGVMNIVALTETQYANLAVKDATTLYVVIPD